MHVLVLYVNTCFVCPTQTSGHWEERVNESGQLVYTNKVCLYDSEMSPFCTHVFLCGTAEIGRNLAGKAFNLWVCDRKGGIQWTRQ
jgi:uncharacterized protein (DUF1919 family)